MSFFNNFSRLRYGTGNSSSYKSSYTPSYQTPSYGGGYSSGSSYGRGNGSNYSSSSYNPYSTYTPSSSASSGSSGNNSSRYNPASSYTPRSNYDTGRSTSSYLSSQPSSTGSRSSASDNVYTPRNARRAGSFDDLPPLPPRSSRRTNPSVAPLLGVTRSGSSGALSGGGGIRKSNSYSGLHWLHDDRNKKMSGDYNSLKTHRRQGSNSSITSADLILETGATMQTGRRGSAKRDLELILGREDHQLVLRIIEENKELLSASTTTSLTSQEQKLVEKIRDASIRGKALEPLDALRIIESH